MNYSEMARQLGVDRKTVASNVRKLEVQGALELAAPKEVYENVNDKYGRAILVLQDLLGRQLSVREAASLLGVSERVLSERKGYFQQKNCD